MSKKVIVGRFGSVFGVQGWLKVISFTDPITNILDYSPWYIQMPQGWQALPLVQGKTHGKNLIVQLPECTTPEQARRYTNLNIAVERTELPALNEGDYYWTDLEGLLVTNTQGKELGHVDHLFDTGANDVIVIKGKKEILIPYIKSVVISVDLAKQLIVVDWDDEFIE